MRRYFEFNSLRSQFRVGGFNVVNGEVECGLGSCFLEKYTCAGKIEEHQSRRVERCNMPGPKLIPIERSRLAEITGVDGDLMDSIEFHVRPIGWTMRYGFRVTCCELRFHVTIVRQHINHIAKRSKKVEHGKNTEGEQKQHRYTIPFSLDSQSVFFLLSSV